MFTTKIIEEMKEVFKEIPFGIEHTLKVLQNAEDIMKGENIEEECQGDTCYSNVENIKEWKIIEVITLGQVSAFVT